MFAFLLTERGMYRCDGENSSFQQTIEWEKILNLLNGISSIDFELLQNKSPPPLLQNTTESMRLVKVLNFSKMYCYRLYS
jgi:hypothetical protein